MKTWSKALAVSVAFFALIACGGSDDPAPQNPQNPQNPQEPETPDYATCVGTETTQSLEVVTWNIENFPQRTTTTAAVQEIIFQMDPDVIAVQEITSMASFNDLVNELEGWTGQVVQFNGSNLMLGYLYKSAEITITQNATQLYDTDTDANDFAFTAFRRPVLTTITHSSGLEVSLINIHLKCCDGSEDRRRAGSDLLKQYIDDNLADDNVIVLGDFNDEIVDNDNVFQTFIDDPDNYRFATLAIASGDQSNFSFPSFPSHIDQILITNELFDNEIETQTLSLDNCDDSYSTVVSDHRPVMIRLSN